MCIHGMALGMAVTLWVEEACHMFFFFMGETPRVCPVIVFIASIIGVVEHACGASEGAISAMPSVEGD